MSIWKGSVINCKILKGLLLLIKNTRRPGTRMNIMSNSHFTFFTENCSLKLVNNRLFTN